jgi:hypothetical protein
MTIAMYSSQNYVLSHPNAQQLSKTKAFFLILKNYFSSKQGP